MMMLLMMLMLMMLMLMMFFSAFNSHTAVWRRRIVEREVNRIVSYHCFVVSFDDVNKKKKKKKNPAGRVSFISLTFCFSCRCVFCCHVENCDFEKNGRTKQPKNNQNPSFENNRENTETRTFIRPGINHAPPLRTFCVVFSRSCARVWSGSTQNESSQEKL